LQVELPTATGGYPTGHPYSTLLNGFQLIYNFIELLSTQTDLGLGTTTTTGAPN